MKTRYIIAIVTSVAVLSLLMWPSSNILSYVLPYALGTEATLLVLLAVQALLNAQRHAHKNKSTQRDYSHP